MHYTATQQATSSINHRLLYVNIVAMVLVVDAGSAMLDVLGMTLGALGGHTVAAEPSLRFFRC